MTNEEARNVIECMITNIVGDFADREMPKGAKHTYDALENAEEALEKQIPKKPTKSKAVIAGANYAYWCPSCKRCFTLRVSFGGRNEYCDMCGQAIDWSYEDDE